MSAIGDYDPELFLNEDYDYWMRIARRFRIQATSPNCSTTSAATRIRCIARGSRKSAPDHSWSRYKNHFLTGEMTCWMGMVELISGQPGPAPSQPDQAGPYGLQAPLFPAHETLRGHGAQVDLATIANPRFGKPWLASTRINSPSTMPGWR
jgi:hypothetical protein